MSRIETNGVSSAILSTIRAGVVKQFALISKEPFNGDSIQFIEKKFLETIGESGACELGELVARNDEANRVIIYDRGSCKSPFLSPELVSEAHNLLILLDAEINSA